MNDENLQPIKKGELTSEEAKRRGRNGGRASVKARRERKTMRETAEYLLNLPQRSGKVVTVEDLKDNSKITKNTNLTNQDIIIVAIVNKARKGDPRAAEFLRDLVGEKPTDRQEVTVSGSVAVDLDTADINQILAEVRKLKKDDVQE